VLPECEGGGGGGGRDGLSLRIAVSREYFARTIESGVLVSLATIETQAENVIAEVY